MAEGAISLAVTLGGQGGNMWRRPNMLARASANNSSTITSEPFEPLPGAMLLLDVHVRGFADIPADPVLSDDTSGAFTWTELRVIYSAATSTQNRYRQTVWATRVPDDWSGPVVVSVNGGTGANNLGLHVCQYEGVSREIPTNIASGLSTAGDPSATLSPAPNDPSTVHASAGWTNTLASITDPASFTLVEGSNFSLGTQTHVRVVYDQVSAPATAGYTTTMGLSLIHI